MALRSHADGALSALPVSPIVQSYLARTPNSASLHAVAKRVMPGGTSRQAGYWAPHPLAVERARGAYFPFVLGETFAFEYLSDLETFITTSSTLREASRVLSWLREFVNPMMDLQLREAGGTARLCMVTTAGVTLKRYYSEAAFASVMKFARGLVGESAGFRRIQFTAAAPQPGVDYPGFFRLPVTFGQAEDAIEFAPQLLDQPLKGHFPSLHQQAERRIERRLAETAAQGPVADAVLRQLAAHSGGGIEVIADELQLHPRSLQRRLRAEGTSFAALQDRARFEAAVAALGAGDIDLESLSEQLGFSDRRSFTRAFKRWTGVSPSSYRRFRRD